MREGDVIVYNAVVSSLYIFILSFFFDLPINQSICMVFLKDEIKGNIEIFKRK